VRVLQPTIEHHEPGRLGIGETRPRLSWRVEDASPTYVQAAARIHIVVDREGGAVEQTFDHPGAEQILVAWPGEDLRSRDRLAVRVQVSDGTTWSEWSAAIHAEVGLLDRSEWVAALVGPAWDEPAGPHRRPGRVRTDFRLDDEIESARLYLTGHGLVEAEINGRRVGDEELTPGWTSYRHRLRYATFDVADLLSIGENAIGVWLGDGWWRGRLGYAGGRLDIYGQRLGARAQLEILTAGGRRVVVASDGTWTAGFGPILRSDLYDGEHFDARAHDPEWSTAGYPADGWTPVAIIDEPSGELVAPTGPPVRFVESLRPVAIEEREPGRWLLDFGQNHSGRLRIRTSGEAGTELRIRHAEVLQHGDVYTDSLRTAQATDVLILDGGPIEWEPRFTIHGYRYAEISGWQDDLTADDVESRVIHTDLERRGWFESSHDLVNKLHENTVWSLRGNFVDIPTDCPQRDERLGWTGDIQVFAPTATFLYDVTGMLGSWLQDLAAEQREFDWVPPFVPYLDLPPWTEFDKDPSAVWGDVAILTPDVLHQRTGDIGLLRRQYASALQWMRHVERGAGPSLICEGTEQLGDWLDPNAPAGEPMKAMTDPVLVATAYYAHSARRMAAIAHLLGETEDAAYWNALAPRVAAAYARRFIGADGRMTDDTQTAYALTTTFDLWPDEASRAAGTARLAELVRASDGRISTGFAGTPVVSDALTRSGHLAEAYQLLESTGRPSWLYAVVNDATTIWERWDALLPDGTVYPGDMTSFNHYALGAVTDWLHRVVAGIESIEPGWRAIRFAPRPGGTLTHASARHLTPYGEASISWRLADGRLSAAITVPAGSRGVVELPGAEPVDVGQGTHEFEVALSRQEAQR
jgi:alpha-L-rhamnosidase